MKQLRCREVKLPGINNKYWASLSRRTQPERDRKERTNVRGGDHDILAFDLVRPRAIESSNLHRLSFKGVLYIKLI